MQLPCHAHAHRWRSSMTACYTRRATSTSSWGKFCWQDLVSGRFERVVWCVEELQAVLPQLQGLDMGIVGTEKELITQRLHEAFVQNGNLRGLRYGIS